MNKSHENQRPLSGEVSPLDLETLRECAATIQDLLAHHKNEKTVGVLGGKDWVKKKISFVARTLEKLEGLRSVSPEIAKKIKSARRLAREVRAGLISVLATAPKKNKRKKRNPGEHLISMTTKSERGGVTFLRVPRSSILRPKK